MLLFCWKFHTKAWFHPFHSVRTNALTMTKDVTSCVCNSGLYARSAHHNLIAHRVIGNSLQGKNYTHTQTHRHILSQTHTEIHTHTHTHLCIILEVGEGRRKRENPKVDFPLSMETDAELNPRSLWSWPELEPSLLPNQQNHSGAPSIIFLNN